MPEILTGLIERVTFHNPENDFAVLKVVVKGRPDFVTVVGNTTSVSAGEHLEATGKWVVDWEHGQQFKADELKTTHPASAEGVEKYLASGAIRSIGPKLGAKFVGIYKERTLEFLETAPDFLLHIMGIARSRVKRIRQSWQEQKADGNLPPGRRERDRHGRLRHQPGPDAGTESPRGPDRLPLHRGRGARGHPGPDRATGQRADCRKDELMFPHKIISGGQTGVDRAALDVALELGIPIGGYLPRGRKDENGDVLPEDRYANMQETDTDDVNVRTELNVQNSDATLIFSHGRSSVAPHSRNVWPECMGSPACTLISTSRIQIKPCCLSRHGWQTRSLGC